MELERYGAAARGLRRYVWLVADALGVGPGCCTVQLESPVHAYLPLDDHLPALPGSDVALTWDPDSGWMAGIEAGPDVVPLARLGGDVLPEPADVVEFVRRFLAGEPHRPAGPPTSSEPLSERLAAYRPQWTVDISREPLGL